MKKSRNPGSDKTRYEEFNNTKPDFKKLILATFGHPVLYLIPKEGRSPEPSEKGSLGVYVGSSDSIIRGIRVYSYKTKRVIDTDTYELLAVIPDAWSAFRKVFAPSNADLYAILIDANAEGRIAFQ